ncbi:reverse transcriptase domain-containing protein [Tanacetum coccineum]
MSDNIPFEIQMEIIKKVPDVESLIRFRSVSKPWKSFIDSRQCIAGYNVHLSQPHRLILRYIDLDSFEEKYLSFLDDNDTFTQQHDSPPIVSDLIKQLEKFSEVVGSSHGLWCLFGYHDSGKSILVLWNPSIRKSVGIVVPYDFNMFPYKTTVFGFGVCPVTCDPTIVRISYVDTNDMDSVPWDVEFFTLSSKRWEMIPTSSLPRQSTRLKISTQVVIDRFIYWAAYDTVVADDGVFHKKHMIMSFDLITKAFKVVDIPDSIINRFIGGFLISKLRESLIVFGYIRDNEMLEDAVCGVWMMVDDGVITSFREIFTIDTPISISLVNEILGFRKSGEPIIEARKLDSQFATFEVYEPRSQLITNLGIYGQDRTFFLSSCTESMLLLDHADCSIY